MKDLIIVRGGGDLATGTIYTLYRSGFPVLILESAHPSAIRRSVAFSEALYDGTSEVEDVRCTLVKNTEEAVRVLDAGGLPIMADETAASLRDFSGGGVFAEKYRLKILVDAIIAKKNLGTAKDMAPLVIALGPGFTAGEDCDLIIETKRGHNLGRIIRSGTAVPNSGIPGNIGGYTKERVIHSPAAGRFVALTSIGDIVEKGQTVALIAQDNGKNVEVPASMSGLLRGILRNGYPVTEGFKIADIDPRYDEHRNCFTISDKARCIGGGVLLAVMEFLAN